MASRVESPTSTMTAAGITLEKHPASPVPPKSPPLASDEGCSRLLGATSPAGSATSGGSGSGFPGHRGRRKSLSPYAVTPGLTNGWPGMVRRHSAEVPRPPGQESTSAGHSPTSPSRTVLAPATAPVLSGGSRLGIPTDYHYARRPSAQCEHIRVRISPGSHHAQIISAQSVTPSQHQHGRHGGHHQHRHHHHASNTSVGSPGKDPSPQGTPKNIYQHRRTSRQLEATGIPGLQAVLLDPGHASTARRLSRSSIDSGQILMAAVRRASHQIDPAEVVQFTQRRVSGERLSNYGDGGPEISPIRGSSSPNAADEEVSNLLQPTSSSAGVASTSSATGRSGGGRSSSAGPLPDLHKQLFEASAARKLRRTSEQRARRRQFVLVASIVFVGLVILTVLLVAIMLRRKPDDAPVGAGHHTGPDHWVRKGGIRDMTDPRINPAGEHHLLPPVIGAERKPVPPAVPANGVANKGSQNTYHPPGRPIQRPKRRKRRRRRRAVK